MPQIIYAKSPVLAAVTGEKRYIDARKEADRLAAEYGLKVADMPMAIQAMGQHPNVCVAIRPYSINTITCEYHGLRKGKRFYEVWHSVGSLSTLKGLENAFSKIGDDGFMPISNYEWANTEKGNCNGQSIARVHINDVKMGNVPQTGTPYTIFVRLDKDANNISISGMLDYGVFMRDDRVLMIAGSLENREALAKVLFGSKKERGEGWELVGSYHRINKVGFKAKANGRLVCLSSINNGIDGCYFLKSGRFLVVDAEPQANKIEALIGQQFKKANTSPALDDRVKDTLLYVPSTDPKFTLKK